MFNDTYLSETLLSIDSNSSRTSHAVEMLVLMVPLPIASEFTPVALTTPLDLVSSHTKEQRFQSLSMAVLLSSTTCNDSPPSASTTLLALDARLLFFPTAPVNPHCWCVASPKVYSPLPGIFVICSAAFPAFSVPRTRQIAAIEQIFVWVTFGFPVPGTFCESGVIDSFLDFLVVNSQFPLPMVALLESNAGDKKRLCLVLLDNPLVGETSKSAQSSCFRRLLVKVLLRRIRRGTAYCALYRSSPVYRQDFSSMVVLTSISISIVEMDSGKSGVTTFLRFQGHVFSVLEMFIRCTSVEAPEFSPITDSVAFSDRDLLVFELLIGK
ncbi:hypothetical protein KQX54_000455 [Cotesia glomerata]|uniref:Uncharacterized protein n=1 Tax=Cotesia glomerata TaxID=32391 RepID=A0AAV7I5P5_COTGL|nr:hypothetical protein KQX54_000455 [Cotesia glomerata]